MVQIEFEALFNKEHPFTMLVCVSALIILEETGMLPRLEDLK